MIPKIKERRVTPKTSHPFPLRLKKTYFKIKTWYQKKIISLNELNQKVGSFKRYPYSLVPIKRWFFGDRNWIYERSFSGWYLEKISKKFSKKVLSSFRNNDEIREKKCFENEPFGCKRRSFMSASFALTICLQRKRPNKMFQGRFSRKRAKKKHNEKIFLLGFLSMIENTITSTNI